MVLELVLCCELLNQKTFYRFQTMLVPGPLLMCGDGLPLRTNM